MLEQTTSFLGPLFGRIGLPQFMQLGAESEISLLQSGQVINGILILL
jgi:hypothetical protein